jgi:ornithine cyclodeaminase/alanine dehydrogenase-like protein (mu-crystallin family)
LQRPPPFLSDADVHTLLDGIDLLPALRIAIRQLKTQAIEVAPRVGIGHGPRGQVTHIMAARDVGTSESVTKVIDYDPSRPSRTGRPSVSGIVTYLSDGEVVFIANASAFTNIRTASTTALALDLLARPDSTILTVFGAGPLAREHVLRVASLRRWTEIRLVSQSGLTADRLAVELGDLVAAQVHSVKTGASAACDGADVVITATSSTSPIVSKADIRPGTLVAAVGSGTPERRELDGSLIASVSTVIVETVDAARREAGDLIGAEKEGNFEWQSVLSLGDLIDLGTPPPTDEVIVYKSVGAAWEDLACARVIAASLERKVTPQ